MDSILFSDNPLFWNQIKMNFQFVMPKTLFSKSFDAYRHPSKSFARIVPSVSWTAKPMSIRSPPNEDELKAFFVSFGYSVEIGKKFRRIFMDEQVSSTAESSKLQLSSSPMSTHQLYCGKRNFDLIIIMKMSVGLQKFISIFRTHSK